MDSVTQIKLKSGPISSFSNNLGNDSREPVWSSDNSDEMLFVTNGVASSPTTVNPIVRYHTTEGNIFQFDTVATIEHSDDYVSSPVLLSSNMSNHGMEKSFCAYTFNTGAITINLYPEENVTWAIYELVIRKEGARYTSGQVNIYDDTQPIVIDNLYFVTIPSYDIEDLYDNVTHGDAFVEITITDANGNSHIIPLSPGLHDSASHKQSYMEDNISSNIPGYNCMETSVSNRIAIRNRILLGGKGYFHNSDDNIDILSSERTVLADSIEENLSIGGYNSVGTISITIPGQDTNGIVNILPAPETAKTQSETNCILPYRSGQIPVIEQSVTGKCDRLVLSDNKCALNTMTAIPENGSSMALVCTRESDNLTYAWSDFSRGVIETTHSKLSNNILNGSLKPGSFYRITDYQTTTTASDTKPAGKQFDIIVLATSTTEISSHAIAINHQGSTYFSTYHSNLSAWKLEYDVFNDTSKYTWATGDDYIIPDGQEIRFYTEDSENYHGDMATNAYFVYTGKMTFNETSYYAWKEIKLDEDTLPSGMSERYVLTDSFITPGSISYNNPYSGIMLWVYIDNEGDGHAYNGKENESPVFCESAAKTDADAMTNAFIAGSLGGKGVIYNMVDEHGNECPYDFKNILFKRKLTNGELDTVSGTDTYVYTFNAYDEDMDEYHDMSVLTGNIWIGGKTLLCNGNTMEPYMTISTGATNNLVRTLNNNVLLNIYSRTDENASICESNTFGLNSHDNTIGNSCQQNIFNDESVKNIIGHSCINNIFGIAAKGNTIGNSCKNNIFGNGSNINTLGNVCANNSIIGDSSGNTIHNNCSRCVIDHGTLNVVSANCSEITIGTHCQSVSIGNTNGLYGTYCENISIAANSSHINIYQPQNEGSEHILKNITTLPGLNNVNIDGITRDNDFVTYVGRNSNNAVVAWNPADMILPNA